MKPLRIRRQRYTNIDHKQTLRANFDQLPSEKQREFISAAFQLLASSRCETAKATLTMVYQAN